MSKSVGEILKDARLGRQITLEQASFATRIRQRYLEALEKDLTDLIPSVTQARGFLRLYAEFLGIPHQQLIDVWDGINLGADEIFNNPLHDSPSIIKDHAVKHRVVSSNEVVETVRIQNNYSSDRIFEEIGSGILKHRTSQGLSLQDIEEHIHVKQHYLELIEAGKLEALPSLVQARGLLHNYISFLQMDIDRIMARFADALQARRIEKAAPTQTRSKVISKDASNIRWKKLLNPDMVIGSVAVLILFLFTIWGASKVSSLRKLQNSGSSFVTNLIIGTVTPIILPTDSIPPVSNTEAVPQNGDTIGEITDQEEIEVQENDDPIQLFIVANQRAYLKVTTDEKIAFNGRTVPGSAYSFSATNKIELLTGNSAALQVFYNQQDIGTIGLVGQQSGIIFSVSGYITPTTQFTATSTGTPQPTTTIPATPTQVSYTITPLIP